MITTASLERMLWKELLKWVPPTHETPLTHQHGIQRWVKGGTVQVQEGLRVQVSFWSPSLRRVLFVKPYDTPSQGQKLPYTIAVHVPQEASSKPSSKTTYLEVAMPPEDIEPLLKHAGWTLYWVEAYSILGDMDATVNHLNT